MAASVNLTSSSLLALAAANLLPLLGVLLWGWPIFSLLLIFWVENLVIGLFNALKMLISGFASRDIGSALYQSAFFVVHYGMFTFIHGLLLRSIFAPNNSTGSAESVLANFEYIGTEGLWWAVLAVFISHGISFATHFLGNAEYRDTTPRRLMLEPYGRIVVLHVCVLLGAVLVQAIGSPLPGLLLLIVLKLGLDIRAHRAQHSDRNDSAARAI